jgi:2-hydroxy-6-oxonona-2,4-dienedioate hydrolase
MILINKLPRAAWRALAFLAVSSGGPAYSATCDFSRTELHAGEDSDIILCANGLPADVAIIKSAQSKLDVVYAQPLERCGVDDKRGGFHIVVNARTHENKGNDELQVIDVNTETLLCSASLSVLPARTIQPPSWLNAMRLEDARYINVNGIRTRYFERGSGHPLVLVHGGQAGGANNSAQKWEQNFDSLAQHYRVIALDRLAQAGTDNLPAAEDYESYFLKDAQHLEAFVKALDLKQVTLVGHSQGGWPVTWLALQRPDLIDCLVNVDTVMVPDDMELMREALTFLIYASRFTNPPTGPTVHSARRAMALRYPNPDNITTAKAQRVVDQYQSAKTQTAREHMAANRITPLHPSFKALKQQAFDAINAGDLQVRSLVIWGEKDPQVPLGLGRQFNDMLKAADVETTLTVIEGAGHAPFVEFPEDFNEIVVNYCTASE